MTRLIGTISDRFVNVFLKDEARAGACVPEHGQICSACHERTTYRYNCYGHCTSASRC